MATDNWKEEVDQISKRRSDWHRNIPRDAECCKNCRHMAWLVGVGQGIRCIIDKGDRPGSQIKGLMEKCDSFEFKQSLKKL
jgi:hypothetical protein